MSMDVRADAAAATEQIREVLAVVMSCVEKLTDQTIPLSLRQATRDQVVETLCVLGGLASEIQAVAEEVDRHQDLVRRDEGVVAAQLAGAEANTSSKAEAVCRRHGEIMPM